MTLYVVTIVSHGEVVIELDGTYCFSSMKKARAKLNDCYENILEDVEGYDILDDDKEPNYYSIMLDDDDGSVYEGYINEVELDEE